MLRRILGLDLLIIIVITLFTLVAVTLQIPYLREMLGLLFLFVSPGYALVAVIYPNRRKSGTATVLSLALAFSIAIDVLIGLILGITPWGFTFNSIILTLSCFTIITSCVAWLLRYKQKRSKDTTTKPSTYFTEVVRVFRMAGWGYRSLVMVLLCLIIGGLGSLGYIMASPSPARPFSEFYILGEDEKADNYPLKLSTSEEGKVIIAIVSHEVEKTDYSVLVKADGIILQKISDVILNPEKKWQQQVSFTLQEVGENRKVEFLLYKNGISLYETLYIWVDVTE